MTSSQTIDKKKLAVIIVSILIIDFVVAFAISKIFLHNDILTDFSTLGSADEQVEDLSGMEAVADISRVETTEAIYGIYELLIIGNYKLDEDIAFNFGSDGSYSGFFDSDNRSVEGCSYELENSEGQTLVHIYNENKSRIVTYIMTLSEDGNIILELPETGDRLELKY